MTNYASEELIERAAKAIAAGDYYEQSRLINDLVLATPLPDNWCAPVGDAIMGEYRPDAEHEAKKLAWWHNINDALLAMDHSWGLSHHEVANPFGRWQKHQAVLDLLNKGLDLMGEKPQLKQASTTDAEHEAAIEAWRGWAEMFPDHSRRNCYIVTGDKIDAICDLARRAPRPGPKPEPRASSALLGAARNALNALRSSGTWPLSEHRLRAAIEAEEARGTSEMDRLRRVREHYKGECKQLRKERDEVRAELAACFGYLPVVPGPALAWDGIHLEPHVVRVADEYAIMRERAEKPEPRASSALLVAARAVWESCPAFAVTVAEINHLSSVNDLKTAIEAEEARGTSQDDRDEELRRYEDCRSRGQLDGFDWVAADALSELVRRALGGQMIDKLKTLHDAATPGPWDHDNAPTGKGGHVVFRDRPDYDVVALTVDAADGALLTSLRNATPAILALVYEARTLAAHIDPRFDYLRDRLCEYDAAVGNEGER